MRPGPMKRGLALLLLGMAAGCSDGPEAGSLQVTVSAPVTVAAVVVEITGEGILGVEEPSEGWIVGEPLPSGAGVPGLRVMVVDETAATLSFRLLVADVGAPPPGIQVVEASDATNRLIGDLSEVRVQIGR